MRKHALDIAMPACVLLLAPCILFAQQDVAGARDHPLFSRMSDYYIAEYEEKPFDAEEFYDAGGKPVTVEGHKYVITYRLKQGATPLSDTQIIRNYTTAIRKIGGVVLEERYQAFMKLAKDDAEIWCAIYPESSGESYRLHIVEKQVPVQEVTANADALRNSIGATGHVAVYDISTGKVDIRPESEPTLKEIARLLQQNASLALFVVGHTDSVGDLALNMKLSQGRAESVVDALVSRYGVDRTRLIPHGVGPLAPVAANRTEAGRAKNRRVELVER